VRLVNYGGFDLDFVLNLPLPAFDRLMGSHIRVSAREKYELLQISLVGSQGTKESINALMKYYQRLIDPKSTDQDAFLRRIGHGKQKRQT
jgi:hypothetical protein